MPYRIIVADSSPSVQKSAQMAFPESDFKLYFFDDGGELVKALDEIRPDAVLLSLTLSAKDAYDVGRHLGGHKEFRKVPLFFLKGTFESFDPDRAADIAYDGVIQKPLDSEKLALRVIEAIDRKMSPPTLPEEPALEDVYPEDAPAAEAAKNHSPAGVGSPDILRSQVRELVQAEILDMERELEKRIKARLAAELKEWLAADKKNSLS